jgi:hypothetical protein
MEYGVLACKKETVVCYEETMLWNSKHNNFSAQSNTTVISNVSTT